MTTLLWAAFGMTVGAGVLHAALGLTRPLDRTYLWFAAIMLFLAGYLYFEWQMYRATTSAEAVEAVRHQLVAAHGFLAFILVFVPAYTRVRLSQKVMTVFWTGLALLFMANLSAPYGVWFSAAPTLVASTFRGEPYNTIVAPPMSLLQYVHAIFVLGVFALTLRCALDVFRRGERQRGAMLAIALVVVILHHVADLVRDAVGGTWPYVAEFGLVAWGLIMSVQLALDFRVSERRLFAMLSRAEQHAAELAKTVDATLRVRDKLNTPLQTLELGLAVQSADRPEDEETLAELRRAVVELTQLGRAVEQTTNQRRITLRRREGAT
jgi:hypothetical protein